MVSLKELDDSMVILVSVDIFNFNEEKNPVIFTEAVGVGGMEVFSVNVELSVVDINQNVELVFAFSAEKVIWLFVDESHVSSVLVKSWVGTCDFL